MIMTMIAMTMIMSMMPSLLHSGSLAENGSSDENFTRLIKDVFFILVLMTMIQQSQHDDDDDNDCTIAQLNRIFTLGWVATS